VGSQEGRSPGSWRPRLACAALVWLRLPPIVSGPPIGGALRVAAAATLTFSVLALGLRATVPMAEVESAPVTVNAQGEAVDLGRGWHASQSDHGLDAEHARVPGQADRARAGDRGVEHGGGQVRTPVAGVEPVRVEEVDLGSRLPQAEPRETTGGDMHPELATELELGARGRHESSHDPVHCAAATSTQASRSSPSKHSLQAAIWEAHSTSKQRRSSVVGAS
jgi:hypothetical protein